MTDVLLLHGAFRGAWSWQRVVPLLREAGHRVVAPDLPGAGERCEEGLQPIGLEAHLDDLERCFHTEDLDAAVVVGHSQGGFLARALSQRVPDRIAALAYLDAPVPAHGQTAWELLPGAGDPSHVRRETVVPATPVQPGSCLPVEDAAWINQRLTPQTVALSLDPVRLTDPAALALPEVYAFCRETPATFPCATTRSALDARGGVYTLLDAGHDAPVTHPGPVAAWILEAVRRVDVGPSRA